MPTGFLAHHSSPFVLYAVGDIIMPTLWERVVIIVLFHSVRLIRIVKLSRTSTDLNISVPCVFAAIAWSRFHLTAAASKSVPSWNFTPFLSVMVTLFPLTSFLDDSASQGTVLPVVSTRKRVSMAGAACRLEFTLSIFGGYPMDVPSYCSATLSVPP